MATRDLGVHEKRTDCRRKAPGRRRRVLHISGAMKMNIVRGHGKEHTGQTVRVTLGRDHSLRGIAARRLLAWAAAQCVLSWKTYSWAPPYSPPSHNPDILFGSAHLGRASQTLKKIPHLISNGRVVVDRHHHVRRHRPVGRVDRFCWLWRDTCRIGISFSPNGNF